MVVKSVDAGDSIGMKHVRYQQKCKGVPVVGGELIVHLDNNNKVTMVNGGVSS